MSRIALFQILIRVGIEFLLATWRAEVIVIAFVGRFPLRALFVHFHLAYRIYGCHFLIHLFSRLISGVYLFNNAALLTTDTELRAIAPAATIGGSSTLKNGNINPAANGMPAAL